MGITDHGGPRLQAPPRRRRPAFRVMGNAYHPENSAKRGLTAVSLVAHVPAVVVKITPPDAVDTVPIAAPILVAETGVLWPSGETEEETKPISFFLLDHKAFSSECPFVLLK